MNVEIAMSDGDLQKKYHRNRDTTTISATPATTYARLRCVQHWGCTLVKSGCKPEMWVNMPENRKMEKRTISKDTSRIFIFPSTNIH